MVREETSQQEGLAGANRQSCELSTTLLLKLVLEVVLRAADVKQRPQRTC